MLIPTCVIKKLLAHSVYIIEEQYQENVFLKFV